MSLDIYIYIYIYYFFFQNNNKTISKQQESQLTIIPFTQPFFYFLCPSLIKAREVGGWLFPYWRARQERSKKKKQEEEEEEEERGGD